MKSISKANWERTDVEPDPLHKLRERIRATEIVESYARSPLDVSKLPDKSYFFSLSGRCVIAYRVANNIAIALGDPVGRTAALRTASLSKGARYRSGQD